jgi:hypothetical protein
MAPKKKHKKLALGLAMVPLDQLHESPHNPRRITDDAFDRLKHDLAADPEMLLARPLIALPTGEVLCGNMRHRAMSEMGWESAPAFVSDLDENRQREWLARDNNPYGDWEPDALSQLVAAHKAAGGNVELLGFARAEANALLDRAARTDAGKQLGQVLDDAPTLADRFGYPPFTVLDGRKGPWRNRKKQWMALGIRGEVGRDDTMTEAPIEDPAVADPRFYEAKRLKEKELGTTLTAAEFREMWHVDTRDSQSNMAAKGASVFDPVICELVYRWFSGVGQQVLDPFAGGSVRGIVAHLLGRHYRGIELRPEQVAANEEQAATILGDRVGHPAWYQGDAANTIPILGDQLVEKSANKRKEVEIPRADLLFTCPPYFNLEVYSDDPADLSRAKDWDAFCAAYADCMQQPVQLLDDDRFAVIVVGDLRHKRKGQLYPLVAETIRIMEGLGLTFYNEAIYITQVGSLRVRVGRQFVQSRKLGKTHQQVLVFVKGDPKAATEAAGEVDADLMKELVDDAADEEEDDDG